MKKNIHNNGGSYMPEHITVYLTPNVLEIPYDGREKCN